MLEIRPRYDHILSDPDNKRFTPISRQWKRMSGLVLRYGWHLCFSVLELRVYHCIVDVRDIQDWIREAFRGYVESFCSSFMS
jgi:hypothetical protein